ncbi:MAG: SRPBCC family protein [Roseiarcus sp.]
MNKIDDSSRTVQPAPLRVSRIFSAPREMVFKAWSSADHIKRWFCPDGYSVPEAKVEMRVGGAFEVCMRSPEGMEHWTRGTFTEVVAPERLTIDHHVVDPCGGGPLFSALTQVAFIDNGGGRTLMEVVQTYSVSGAAQAEQMIKGAPEGWRQTLDKLEAEVARMQGNGGNRSVVHGAFHLERIYDATAEQVYKALSDEAAKNRWFYGPQGSRPIERFMDFRVGGRERAKGRFEGGVTTTFDAVYNDIVPRERIVYTYEMHLDERKISVSLATLQIKPEGEGRTKLLVDEQGAFLDGYDDAGSRERGTANLLDKLGASLTA